MEDESFIKKDKENQSISLIALIVAVIELAAVIASGVVLGITADDCDRPVRTWLEVCIGILGFHAIFLLIAGRYKEKFGGMPLVVNTVILCFLCLWMQLGIVWIYYDDDCANDFSYGYYMVLFIAGSFFGSFLAVIILLLLVVFIVCAGSFMIKRIIKEVEEDE